MLVEILRQIGKIAQIGPAGWVCWRSLHQDHGISLDFQSSMHVKNVEAMHQIPEIIGMRSDT